MKRYRRILIIMALAIGAFVMSAVLPTAHATFMLRLDDINQPGVTTIVDEGAGDIFKGPGGVGTITFLGSVGVFNIVVTTGVSKPVLGNPTSAEMDLNSITVTTGPGSGGALKISLTDTDFTIAPVGPGFSFVSAIGGDAGTSISNSLTYDSFFDPSNTAFNTAVPPTYKLSLGPFVPSGGWGSGTFNSTTSTTINPSVVPFALTQEVMVTLGANQTASFNATVHAGTPEPTTLLLFGCGLIGMAAYGWRRKKKQI